MLSNIIFCFSLVSGEECYKLHYSLHWGINMLTILSMMYFSQTDGDVFSLVSVPGSYSTEKHREEA
jgi:hypothetical protein